MDFISTSSGILRSPMARSLMGYQLVHSFFGMVRTRRGKRLTKKQRRRLMNRRRRWFTDNVIMHHKRLHDKNRQLVITSAKDRLVARKSKKKATLMPQESKKWRERVEIRDRGKIIRGRISAKKLRARSRWLSVSDVSVG